MFWWFIRILFIFFVSVITYYSVKFRNPYKLYMIFGAKGSGKTTLLTKLAYQHARKHWNVYSTVPVPGAHLIEPSDIGHIEVPSHSVIFVDEVGLFWHNRDFKNFDKSLIEYFKLQRHYGHKIYLFSQAWDIDKVLRNLTDKLYIVDCYFSCISIARRIKHKLCVVHPQGDSESRIADDLILEPFFLFWLGSCIFTWVPHWAKHFDSFASDPKWQHKELEYYPLPQSSKDKFLSQIKGYRNPKRRKKSTRRNRIRT